MEEKSTKSMIEEQIRSLIEKLEVLDPKSESYGTIVKNIRELVNSYNELDKTEAEKNDRDRKFAEEIRYKDQELHYKDALERDKLSDQKKAGTRDAIIKIGSFVLNIVPTTLLALLGMKLEFIDHGSVCTFGVKELVKKASQGVSKLV